MSKKALLTIEEIKEFILNESTDNIGKNDIEPNTDLFELNIIDSLGVMKLLAFIEERSGNNIDLGEIDFEDFQTIENIINFLSRTD